MATAKNVKQAMDSGNYRVKNIYDKGSKKIRVDFEPRYAHSCNKHCSFWNNRDYFKINYPKTYDRFSMKTKIMIKTISEIKEIASDDFEKKPIAISVLNKLKPKMKSRPRGSKLKFDSKYELFQTKQKQPVLYFIQKMNNGKQDGYMIFMQRPVVAYLKNQQPRQTPVYRHNGEIVVADLFFTW